MGTVKPITEAVERWGANSQAQSAYYAKNASAAAETWVKGAVDGNPNYQQSITAAGIAARQKAGIVKAGSAKYKRKIDAHGQTRFSQGIVAGKPDYSSNTAPFFETLAAISYPPRAPRGDPRNNQRTVTENSALNTKRLAMLGMSS